ncbi:MAG: RNA polymerase sigma-70 factor [Chitinophagaceae bacterium]|nr:RNA polymerase sigma-70 factor [Chitinophagaceae bacterium]
MSGKTFTPDISIDRFREGDRDEFKRVYDSCYEELYIFAYNLVRKETEAQDITSETFIKLWRLRGNFESLSNIRAFLFVTCRNACIDYLRFLQKQRTVHKEIQYLEEMEADEKNEMINAKVLGALSKKIESLPDKCRRIFELIYINNLSTSEVAAQMGVSNQNVLNQKARAISILRSSLLTAELSLILLFFFI